MACKFRMTKWGLAVLGKSLDKLEMTDTMDYFYTGSFASLRMTGSRSRG